MLFGRPINLWTGFVTSAVGVVTIVLITAGQDPVFVGTLMGGVASLLGALIALVAGQPPTIAPDSAVNVQTAAGQPNATATLGLEQAPSGETVVTATTVSQ